jgi:hypothetical protein
MTVATEEAPMLAALLPSRVGQVPQAVAVEGEHADLGGREEGGQQNQTDQRADQRA